MKYYKITCYTPYCGEENTYYFKTKDPAALAKFIDECVIENADEWHNEQVEEDYHNIEEYYDDCTYCWKLITKEEYEEECPWDREED